MLHYDSSFDASNSQSRVGSEDLISHTSPSVTAPTPLPAGLTPASTGIQPQQSQYEDECSGNTVDSEYFALMLPLARLITLSKSCLDAIRTQCSNRSTG